MVLARILVLAFVALNATGCGALRVRESSARDGGLSIDGLALQSGLSDSTTEVIAMLALDARCRRSSAACASDVLTAAGTVREATRLLAASELHYRTARAARGDSRRASAIRCAQHSYRYLHAKDVHGRRNPLESRSQLVLRLHNACIAMLVADRSGAQGAETAIRWHTDDTHFPRTAVARIELADRVHMRGLRTRQIDDGLGVAAVAVGRTLEASGTFPAQPFALAINIRMEPDAAGTPVLVITDASRRRTVDTAMGAIALARDVSAAYALAAIQFEDELSAWDSLRQPVQDNVSQVRVLAPVDAGKTPLVLIHGFASSPVAWANVANELLGDPDIAEHYQIWLARYSTGLPMLVSRRDLANSIGGFRDRALGPGATTPMVMVGHSMGGVLTRLLVSDSGDALWNAAFTVAPDQLHGDPSDVAQARELFMFQALPRVDTVVFMAAPHGGATMADGMLAAIVRRLIRLPSDSLGFLARLMRRAPDDVQPALRSSYAQGGPKSLDTLSPEQPVIQVARGLPIATGVAVHSIIGIKNTARPERGDGVVPLDSALWSSGHEYRVNSGHDVQVQPQTVLILKQILLDRLEQQKQERPCAIRVWTKADRVAL